MCGLVYIKRKDGRSAVKAIKKRYRKQKFRGQDGFGYVAIKDDVVVSYQRATTEHEILQKLDLEDAEEILFHHRMPTSTENMEEQAHPLLIKSDELEFEHYVAHNGVIQNPFLRKQDHNKLNILYSTELIPIWKTTTGVTYHANLGARFNDSEALAVDTALVLEGKANFIEAEGSAAVIALKVKDNKVVERIFYRNSGNPLKYDNTKHMITIASQGHGFDVLPTYIAHLKEDKLVVREPKLLTPAAYTTPCVMVRGGVTKYPSTYTGRYEDDGVYLGDDFDDYHIDFPSQPQTPHTTPLLPAAKSDVLTAVSNDDLWEEYDKLLGVIKDFQTGIEIIDAKVMLVSETSEMDFNNLVKGRKRLQTSLDTVLARKARVDAEVDRRILAKAMNNVSG